MGFISAILEHEVIVSLLLAGTVLGTVSKHECGGPLHTQSARESGAEKGSWKGSWPDLRSSLVLNGKLPEFSLKRFSQAEIPGLYRAEAGPH